ncbi:MAG TPA: tetratricopeptide repeat protein [Longimicrobium sp.]|nr:tetratricopeptide repeat protein [Longimicrobium sp.]
MNRRTRAAAAAIVTVMGVAGGVRVVRGTPLPPLPETVPQGMAQVALRQQDIALFERRVQEDPFGGSDRARLAYLYLQRARETGDYQNFRRAEAVARASVEVRGRRNTSGRLALASSLLAQHRFAEARVAAEELVANEPESPSARALLAEIQMELGDYDGARGSFGWLGRAEDDLSVSPRLARWEEVQGLTVRARSRLYAARHKVASRSDLPREQVAWFHLRVGDIELRNGRLRQAERAFREGLAVEPGDHRLYAGLARVEAARGRWRRVLEYGARTGDRADLATLALMGDAHAALGEDARAEEMYAAVEDGYAANPEPFARQWSQFRLDHGRSLAQTRAVLEDEARARPDVLGADMLAWARYLTGDLRGARDASRQALRLGTRDASFHFHAGMIEKALGNAEGARAHLQKALEINPHFHPASVRQARAALRELD